MAQKIKVSSSSGGKWRWILIVIMVVALFVILIYGDSISQAISKIYVDSSTAVDAAHSPYEDDDSDVGSSVEEEPPPAESIMPKHDGR